VKGKFMKKRFFEKQNVIKNIKRNEAPLVLFAPLVDFYPMSDKQKKIEKSEYDFSIFSLVLYVRNFQKG